MGSDLSANRPARGTFVRIVFRALAAFVPLLLLAFAAELGVRLLVPAERWKLVDATHHWQLDPTLGWVQQGGLDSYSIETLSNEKIPLQTNGDGLLPSSARRERSPGSLRILLVGDSTIVGAGVEESRRIHRVLAEQLSGRGVVVDVVNGGTQGFATDQALLRLEQLIGLYTPDVVLHCVCSNDFVANTLERNHGLNKPSFRLDDAGQLVANPFTVSDRIPEMGSGPGKLIQRSALYRLLRPRLVVLRARMGGWEARNLIGLDFDWYYDERALEQVDWALFGALVERMQETAREHGALFAVYVHPDVGAVWDPVIDETRAEIGATRPYDRFALEQRVGDELERRGIRFVPLVDYFAERQERGPFHLLPRDPHCNATGYLMEAERLGEFLVDEEGLGLSSRPPGSVRSAPADPPAPPAGRSTPGSAG